MSITITIATYLIFLAYINLILRGRIHKDSSLFFFFFLSCPFLFFLFFLGGWGGGGWESLFFLLFFSWGLGVPVLPWWIHGPFQGYYQIILVVNERWVILGERDELSLLFQCNKSDAIMWLSNFVVDILQFHDWQHYVIGYFVHSYIPHITYHTHIQYWPIV